jgi:uncharacterized membrane protein YdbT with pleckstrin-like domain
MYNLAKGTVLRILKVPPEPNDPFGEEDSVRVFRAAPNYLKYKLLGWAIGMGVFVLASVAGLIVLHVISFVEGGAALLLNLVALIGWVLLALIVGWSYMTVRLDYEMRWYKVSDRSLRIREGVFFVREMTMTFANIQNLSITQGPLQRYFGIYDLKVQTAGGGGAATPQQQQQAFQLQMHVGYFRGVDNAEEIRNLIRERLRLIKDSGLGDLEEQREERSAEPQRAAPVPRDLAALLAQVRDEAQGLREAAAAARAPKTMDTQGEGSL